ncbi:MAG: pyrimidine dimer DNA glycosylase/endonuclease V [Candidatus Anstonellaceae archaeon]
MRLWSIHPQYLDTIGLIALWREGLLAKKVLEGKTKRYKNHPQLLRFKTHPAPLKAINTYLYYVMLEAKKRGYNFDSTKVKYYKLLKKIKVSSGQIEYEFLHLLKKLKKRDYKSYKRLLKINTKKILPHPLIQIYRGEKESWEK